MRLPFATLLVLGAAIRLGILDSTAAVVAGETSSRPNILRILADNWSWPHASVLGDPAVQTPAFDRLAKEGVLFSNAFCPVPSCSPTRASLLTGRPAHQLEDAASLFGGFSSRFSVFPSLLRDAGRYAIGYGAKGWGPGHYKEFGWSENPVGPHFGPERYGRGTGADPAAEQDRAQFQGFEQFIQQRPAGRPFFFWMGFTHPGRPTWIEGAGASAGLKVETLRVPACLPDVPEVRSAMLDYYAAIVRLDALIGKAIDLLAAEGLLESTVIVCCGDNGWQMPRGLATVYDTGCHVPFVVRWPRRVKQGQVIEDFVSLTDLAPTFLELAGLPIPAEMTGSSFLDLLVGGASQAPRDCVFLERERHANTRHGNASYPVRAMRTHDFLYIRNLRPERWPAGDPEVWFAVGDFGDVDDSAAKQFLLTHREHPDYRRYFELSFGKRPAEELYDLRSDPDQLVNVAASPQYADIRAKLRGRLDQWMRRTADPRVDPDTNVFDDYPYFGRAIPGAPGAATKKQ